MTNKVYRSANGKTVDMGKLALQNEKVRAVGNMNVNARGDVLDDTNKIISRKPTQVNQAYNTQVNNPRKNK
jgi:glycine cleavage system H lipoate-binding protein